MHERHCLRCARASEALPGANEPSTSSASVPKSTCIVIPGFVPPSKLMAQSRHDAFDRAVDAALSVHAQLQGDLFRRPPLLEPQLEQSSIARLELSDRDVQMFHGPTRLAFHQVVFGPGASSALLEFVTHMIQILQQPAGSRADG